MADLLTSVFVLIGIGVALIVAAFTGGILRGILVKDDYKLNATSIIVNIVIGIVAMFIINQATKP